MGEWSRPRRTDEGVARTDAELRKAARRGRTMNIAVIGSTSRTGRLVIDEGLRRGHGMTAFTRRPEELSSAKGLRAVVQGDGRNLEDVRRAIMGQDAVISIVSPTGRGPTTVVSEVSRATLAAMRESGVRRLVVVSVYALQGWRPWIAVSVMRWIFRRPFEDFTRMERLIAESGLDWTVVRPPYLTEGPATRHVRMATDRVDFVRGPYSISRADLATALLDLAEDSSHVGDIVLVSRARINESGTD